MATVDEIGTLDPYEFESFVADVWEAQGWDTEVMQASGDAGIDVIARRDTPVRETHVIQAKYYSEGNKVGGPEIQQYAALKQQLPEADAVVVVTTSSFTRAAKQRAEELNVKLINGAQLKRLVERLDTGSPETIPATPHNSLDDDHGESQPNVLFEVAYLSAGVAIVVGEFLLANFVEVFKLILMSYIALKFVDVLVFDVPII